MVGHVSISSWTDVWTLVKSTLPNVFVTGKFNFITIHYCYIIGVAILLSVIVYGIGNMPYIDALFLSAGSCTQSGLNTININDTATGQQVMLYLGAMLCNPIVIHSSVVFIRLYWFEKRFEDVVKEARSLRRTKSKSRSNTFNEADVEQGDYEHNTGAAAKLLELLRQTGRKMSLRNMPDQEMMQPGEDEREKSAVPQRDVEPRLSSSVSRRRNSAHSAHSIRLPQKMNPEQHILFLENQRNPKDDVTLRIPSPREFDRGGKPENITERTLPPQTPGLEVGRAEVEEGPRRAHIGTHLTFNEPEIVRDRPRTGNIPPRLNRRNANTDHSGTASTEQPRRILSRNSFRRSATARTAESMPYLSWEPTIGRNSFFVNLSEEQREELGGIEYRALKTLALVLLFYFFAFHIFGVLCLTPWIYTTSYGAVVTGDGQGRAWWGIFTAGSAFNDLGFTLTPDSMISFQEATFILLVMTFLIIIGNTGFPCMLRFMIWALSKCVREGSSLWEELQFLLDHPRRCFTLLFPRSATWWLFAILILLNGVDLLFFVVLDLNNTAVTSLSGWEKFLDGLFQAASTRTAGFAVVNLAQLHPAIQVSYLIMMYISVFPIAISVRRTNVYEEKSLGIYGSASEEEDGENEPSYVGAHLRKQLSFDLWYIFLGLFIISIVEGDNLQNTNEFAFTIFSCLFEIVSAYGTVGLSLGYPDIDASLSAKFRVLSKLVIIAMQIRGRHRGLPYELDRAVLLPSESLQQKEQKDAERLMQRRPSMAMSMMSAVDSHIEPGRFRAETGLSSGFDHLVTPISSRDRRYTDKSQNTSTMPTSPSTPIGPLRKELGQVMYKLASAPDAIKEELENNSSFSD